MRARCAFNHSSALPDEQRGRMADFEETFPLTVGADYLVVGMCLWENVLYLLVRDDWGKPCLARAGLFDLGAHELPDAWRFALCPGIRASGREMWSEPCIAVWGYSELVDDTSHLAALEERDPGALEIFEREVAAATSSESE